MHAGRLAKDSILDVDAWSSHQQIVVEETATSGAAILFGALAVLDLVAFRSLFGLTIAIPFALLALYAAVKSSFLADRNRQILIVRRRLWVWDFEKVYKAAIIDRIIVRSTIKENGLEVRFKSGSTKDLTLSLGSAVGLEDLAGALNHFL
jgi:hypothetical protein